MDKFQQIIASCEELSQQFLKKFLEDYFKDLESRLLEFADKAQNNAQQWQLLEVSRQLKQQKFDMEVTYLVELKEGFRLFAEGKLAHTQKPRKEEDHTDLSLIADDTLEIELAQSSFARRAETRFTEDLYAIHQRLAMITGGKKITEDSNPVGPTQLAICLEKAMPLLTDEIKIKVLAYKVFEKNMLRRLGDLYRDINQCLIDAGVLPNLRYSVNKSPESKTENADGGQKEEVVDDPPVEPQAQQAAPSNRRAGDRRSQGRRRGDIPMGDLVPQGFPAHVLGTPAHYVPVVPREIAAQIQAPNAQQPTAAYQQDLLSAIRAMQQGIVRPQGWRLANAQNASDSELVSVLNKVQAGAADAAAQLENEDIVPCSSVSEAGAVSQRLQEELGKESGKNINEEKANTIDLVGMIFEYMLNDEELPDKVKSALSYLHTPYLKIAFLDEALFAKSEHPARQLLNELEQIGAKWVNDDGSSQFKAFPKIKGVVRRILTDLHEDLSLVEDLLGEVREFDEKVQRNVELLEKRAAQKAEGEDRLKQVKKKVHDTVKSRIAEKKLPSPIIVLLLHPWSEYLTFVLLRFGDESEQWKQALAVVDNILWSVEPKSSAEDQKRLMTLQESLQESLKQGFNSISYDNAKANKLLDAIHDIHAIALQNRATQSASKQAREEIEATAVGHEEAQQASQEPSTPEERELVEKLRMVEFGTWVEFDEIDGHANQKLKIAWFNSKTLQYMLVNRAGKQAAVLSAVEIARHMLSKNARMVSGTAKPFFERALENIFSRMQASAA